MAIRFTVGGLLMLGLLRIPEPTSQLLAKDLFPMAGLGCLGVPSIYAREPLGEGESWAALA